MKNKRLLHIAITVDPEIPVPPKHYGGIERMVDMLVRGLVGSGHQVTLFAHPDSDVPCRLVPYYCLQSQSKSATLRNMRRVSAHVLRLKPDVVHSFARLAYLMPILPLSIPKLMSYQREISARSVGLSTRLSRGTLHFAGCSEQLIKRFANQENWHAVYNGAPIDVYEFQSTVRDDAPLVFLGRVQEIKGAHLAIEVAKRSGRPLVIAGNVPEDNPAHQKYFDEQIQPHLDGKQIQYIGPVNDDEKNQLLGRAAAFLMPILWEEPFGIVMAEALACGAPVIGLRRGSVPEVVQNGVNGFVCDTVDEMVAAVDRINELDRAECRRIMEEKFSDRAMVYAYESLYFSMTAGS
jgi:glycosyltransferase involved in cell wall biosynthesis